MYVICIVSTFEYKWSNLNLKTGKEWLLGNLSQSFTLKHFYSELNSGWKEMNIIIFIWMGQSTLRLYHPDIALLSAVILLQHILWSLGACMTLFKRTMERQIFLDGTKSCLTRRNQLFSYLTSRSTLTILHWTQPKHIKKQSLAPFPTCLVVGYSQEQTRLCGPSWLGSTCSGLEEPAGALQLHVPPVCAYFRSPSL